MMLLAPALFSITTGCPSRSCSFWHTRRAVMSVNPPGVYGTITLIGRPGHACACTGDANAAAPAASAAEKRRREIPFAFTWPPARRFDGFDSHPDAEGRLSLAV